MVELKDSIKVAIIQSDIFSLGGDKDEVLNKVSEKIDECMVKVNDVDLICLPENCTTRTNVVPQFIPMTEMHREPIPGPTTQLLCKKAAQYHVYIIAGLIRLEGEDQYSCGILIGPDGEIKGIQDKRVIGRHESHVIKSGSESFVFDTTIGKIGILVGNDINSFRVCSDLVSKEAEIVVCPSLVPEFYIEARNVMEKSRTVDMDAFVISAHGIGEFSNSQFSSKFAGRSMILKNPMISGGDGMSFVIAEAGEEECIIYGECNIKELKEKRKNVERLNKGDETK